MFDFSSDGRLVPKSGGGVSSIKIRDSETGQEIPIKMLNINQAHKTLGHFKAPGKQKRNKEETSPTTQVKLIRKKVAIIAREIAMSTITRYGVKLAYNTIYTPAVQYALPQNFFEEDSLDK